ncbi:MAG: DUF350 domain-containing protein [Anaerolineales bacterium]|nr:DUF350 domain-containing protein [Anaerolineales bacterium]
MNIILINFARLAVSIVLSALATYLGIWLFERFTRTIDEWEALREKNLAVGITLASVVVGLAIILQPAVSGMLPAASGRLALDMNSSMALVATLGLILVRAVLGIIIGIVAIRFSVWLFTQLTRNIDEMAELENGNLAVAVMLGGVILAVSWLMSPIVDGVTTSLIIYFLP